MTNNESLFASLHILMRAILMAQRTPAAGFTDTGIEEAAAKSTSAGKNKISVNLRNLRLINSCLYSLCLCAKKECRPSRPQMARYASRFTRYELCSLLEQSLPRTPTRLKQNQCNLRNLRLKNSWLFSSFLCAFCAFLWLKTPRSLRNLLLIKDLRACKVLYNCRETFTDVMSALQIKLFLQNEPNFRKVKLNVNKGLTKDYEQMDTWSIRKKRTQTNPNEPKRTQIQKGRNERNFYINKGI
jgi:hypothetical protein